VTAEPTTTRVDERFLHDLILTVGSSLELADVLEGVVGLLSEASAVHACFVYLLDRDRERLVLSAASAPYAIFVGRIDLVRGEGLAWWALERREPAFIREKALEDPRVKYVPELEEERFQSLVAIPVLGRLGDGIGVITLDTVAPREFTDSEVELLVSSASLVAGAIENARLYDEMRERVGELEHLTELAESVATAETIDELGPVVVTRARSLLGAEAVSLYLLDANEERLGLRWTDPAGSAAPASIGLGELGPELGRAGRSRLLSVSLIAGDELLGALIATGTKELELARAVSNQAAVALKKIQAIERLSEKNLIRDFFEDLAARRADGVLESRAARLGVDLGLPHVVLAAEPVDEAFARALAAAGRGWVLDRRERALRALVPLAPDGAGALLERLRAIEARAGAGVVMGVSSVRAGAAALADGLEEARYALLGAPLLLQGPGVVAYEELGPYRYLLRIALDPRVGDPTIDAVSSLAAYDRRRGTSLLHTLEQFLAHRGAVSATSEALFVHPNTLRQRLGRIGEISGIDLGSDDWLAVEIALKLVRVRAALGMGASHT
jgi:GAF domain-containing protein